MELEHHPQYHCNFEKINADMIDYVIFSELVEFFSSWFSVHLKRFNHLSHTPTLFSVLTLGNSKYKVVSACHWCILVISACVTVIQGQNIYPSVNKLTVLQKLMIFSTILYETDVFLLLLVIVFSVQILPVIPVCKCVHSLEMGMRQMLK